MIVIVRDDSGAEAFSYDTDNAVMIEHPSDDELPEVVAALDEAVELLMMTHAAR